MLTQRPNVHTTLRVTFLNIAMIYRNIAVLKTVSVLTLRKLQRS